MTQRWVGLKGTVRIALNENVRIDE